MNPWGGRRRAAYQEAMEQTRTHLAPADSELEAALRFLDPKTEDELERDVVRAVASARTSVGDALETIRAGCGSKPRMVGIARCPSPC